MSFALVTLCLALVADEPIAPEKAAVIERDQQKAQAEVSAKYGNKKPSELSQEERRQMVKDQSAADKEVLEKNGVDAKQWARESIKKDRAAYAEGKQAQKDLAEKDKAEALKKTEKPAKEIEVQRGISEENPVTLDEKQNAEGQVPVEKGLPPEAARDQEAASGGESRMDSPTPAPEAAKPAKAGKNSRRR